MQELIQDAVAHGAKLVSGGTIIDVGDDDDKSTLMEPALVYPVRDPMRLYTEEQFGPIVAVSTYNHIDEILAYSRKSESAQQVAVFGSDLDVLGQLIDAWGSVYGKINWNVAPGRSPDSVPISGRTSSAMGVMSIRDALLEFSVPTVVASPKKDKQLIQQHCASTFLSGGDSVSSSTL